jgi:phosphate transport system protein
MQNSIIPLNELKQDITEMMELVSAQTETAVSAFFDFNVSDAEKVIIKEKEVNAFDLMIDKKSEKLMALYQPVANDLRYVISIIKINTYLERIGDNAQGIAKYSTQIGAQLPDEFLDKVGVKQQIQVVTEMFNLCIEAFENDDTKQAALVLTRDKEVDEINKNSTAAIIALLESNAHNAHDILLLQSVIRKLERVGDLLCNIAEDVIFYVDAKVLRHKNKKRDKYISKNLNEGNA